MEEPSSQDSREDLFYTTTSDVFEYTPYDIERVRFSSAKIFSPTDASLFLKKIYRSSLVGFTTFFYVLFDFVKFVFAYIAYLGLKIEDFFILLEFYKSWTVKTLMWRRGLLFRPATHGGVIILTALAILVGGLFGRSNIAAQDLTLAESALSTTNTPETIIPTDRPRAEVVKYRALKGDTLSEIGEKFDVSANSIKWANDLSSRDSIKQGDLLNIPPVSGVIHKVKKSQTIYSIAKKYNASPQAVADFPFNYIDESLSLRIGQTLVVPGGAKPETVVVPLPGVPPASQVPVNYAAAGSGLFGWPSPARAINQYPSWFHPGVDIGASYGSGVYAASGGRVITATRVGTGFGWHIFVDHGNGYVTAYAHLSDIKVNVGQNVSKGQLIGAVGCSGLCTGAHLHFEVRRNGSAINPLSVL